MCKKNTIKAAWVLSEPDNWDTFASINATEGAYKQIKKAILREGSAEAMGVRAMEIAMLLYEVDFGKPKTISIDLFDKGEWVNKVNVTITKVVRYEKA